MKVPQNTSEKMRQGLGIRRVPLWKQGLGAVLPKRFGAPDCWLCRFQAFPLAQPTPERTGPNKMVHTVTPASHELN